MTIIFVSHKVRDYDGWLVGYNADAERRQENGLTEAGHFHKCDDRNNFFIVWNTEMSRSEAEGLVNEMFNNPELEALMEEAGVLEKPNFWVAVA
jgi:hypothetical protein